MNRTTGALALLAAGISTISASTLGNDWTIYSVAQLSCCNATTTARY